MYVLIAFVYFQTIFHQFEYKFTEILSKVFTAYKCTMNILHMNVLAIRYIKS